MAAHIPHESTRPGRARLMLRRHLALWKARRTIEDTVAFCRETGVGEVIWKIDPEDFNHGHTSHALIRDHLPWLEEARARLESIGVAFSINPWLTLGHIGRHRYPRGAPEGFRWRVLPDGRELAEMACPLAAGWREWLLGAYRLYAQLRPAALWIEDDFKTFGHRGWVLGCFCEPHLAAFAARIGATLDRAELVARLVAPGAPWPERATWFDFQGEIMVALCRDLAQVVHAVSPATRLGLMCSWSSDGRWWDAAVRALAGPHRPLARTSLAPYAEGRAIEYAPDRFDILKETTCLPAGTENCPELENSTYTPYSKSARVTRLQMALSQLLGHAGLTMNLFDMTGGATSEDPRVGRMLREVKPKLDAIAAVLDGPRTPRGIAVPFNPRHADFVRAAPGEGFDAFRFDGDGWCLPLQGSGLPVVLNGAGGVAALTGRSAQALPARQIEDLLGRGLLLDGSAAFALCGMGYGRHLGVEVGPAVARYDVLLSAERDDGAAPGPGGDPVYLTLRNLAPPEAERLHPLRPGRGARVLSTCVDPDHRAAMPGFTAFENELGGRVVACPFDLSGGIQPGFMNWNRRRQLQRLVRWLGRNRVALIAGGGAWMAPLRWDLEDRVVLGVLNLETDPWDEIVLTFDAGAAGGAVRFQRLDADGGWVEARPREQRMDGAEVTAAFDAPVAPLDFAVYTATARKEP